ncbi:hypothetical protein K523DRAFT_280704, partial [Schizophyllum commune Tattone D]
MPEPNGDREEVGAGDVCGHRSPSLDHVRRCPGGQAQRLCRPDALRQGWGDHRRRTPRLSPRPRHSRPPPRRPRRLQPHRLRRHSHPHLPRRLHEHVVHAHRVRPRPRRTRVRQLAQVVRGVVRGGVRAGLVGGGGAAWDHPLVQADPVALPLCFPGVCDMAAAPGCVLQPDVYVRCEDLVRGSSDRVAFGLHLQLRLRPQHHRLQLPIVLVLSHIALSHLCPLLPLIYAPLPYLLCLPSRHHHHGLGTLHGLPHHDLCSPFTCTYTLCTPLLSVHTTYAFLLSLYICPMPSMPTLLSNTNIRRLREPQTLCDARDSKA